MERRPAEEEEEERVVHGRDLAEEEGEIPDEVKHNLPPAHAREEAGEAEEEESTDHDEAMAAMDKVKGLNSGAPSR